MSARPAAGNPADNDAIQRQRQRRPRLLRSGQCLPDDRLELGDTGGIAEVDLHVEIGEAFRTLWPTVMSELPERSASKRSEQQNQSFERVHDRNG